MVAQQEEEAQGRGKGEDGVEEAGEEHGILRSRGLRRRDATREVRGARAAAS